MGIVQEVLCDILSGPMKCYSQDIPFVQFRKLTEIGVD